MEAMMLRKMKAIKAMFPAGESIGTWFVCDDWDGLNEEGMMKLPKEPYIVGSVEIARQEKIGNMDVLVFRPLSVAKVGDDYIIGTEGAIEAYCDGIGEKQRVRLQRGVGGGVELEQKDVT